MKPRISKKGKKVLSNFKLATYIMKNINKFKLRK